MPKYINTKYVDALRGAFIFALQNDQNVILFGLDVDDHKGIQGSTLGLQKIFGAERVFSTPMAEDSMTGVAIGAALAGLRPIHVHIRMDFMLLCMNQLVNMAAKISYMYDGAFKVPLVVRAMIGRSWGQGAQHSQALHSLFMHIPGLKVVAPSNAYDAKGLMLSAIKDDNPVIFIEHRLLYDMQMLLPENYYEVAFGRGRIVTCGNDITIVAVSHMVVEATRAHMHLLSIGISAEIIDPISLKPLDIDLIINSARKTKRLLVVDNAWLTCGLAAEIIALVAENLNEEAAKIKYARLGFAETPCPTAKVLENQFYPSEISITKKAYHMVTENILQNWKHAKIAHSEIDAFRGPF